MATIINYLKGNYLISNFPFLVSLEYETNLNEYSHKLSTYSLSQNQKLNDRNVMIIDFDLRLKEKLFISKPSTKTSAGELQILTENNNIFFIPVRKNFCKNSKINDFLLKKDGLLTLIELMKKEFPKIIDTKKPGLLYIFGLEILEFYFKDEEIIQFFIRILKDLHYIKQIFVDFRSNILSEELLITLKKLTTAQIIIEKEINSQEKSQKKAKVKLIVNKRNGYSIQENLLLTYDLLKDSPSFEKYKEEKKVEENPEIFNATFNLNVTEAQKKAKEQIILPYLSVQKTNPTGINKHDLVELENEDLDLEDDDEDDIDV